MRFSSYFRQAFACAILAGGIAAKAYAVPIATYQFNNTLSANQGGVASLAAIDPEGAASFSTDTVFGQSRTVYNFGGNASPQSEQGGLSLDTTGLITSNLQYSVEMVFKFTDANNAWRRILDVQDSASDNGFYVDPNNKLDVFPDGAGANNYVNGDYHHIVLTDDNGTAKAYLDGGLEFTLSTNDMDINNPSNLLLFFIDNAGGAANTEYSPGSVSLINLYDSVLSDSDVAALYADQIAVTAPVVPEPATLSLLAIGLAGAGALRRRRIA